MDLEDIVKELEYKLGRFVANWPTASGPGVKPVRVVTRKGKNWFYQVMQGDEVVECGPFVSRDRAVAAAAGVNRAI